MRVFWVIAALSLAGCAESEGGGSGDEDEAPAVEDDAVRHNGTNPLIEVVEPPVNATFDLEFTIVGAAEAHVEGENCVQVMSEEAYSISGVRIDATWNATGDADRELSLIVFFGEADGGSSASSYATMDSPLSAEHDGYADVDPDDVVAYGLNTGSLGVTQDLAVDFRLTFEYEGARPVEFEQIACSLLGPK